MNKIVLPVTISIDPTPNPQSLKFSSEGSTFLHSGLVSVSSTEECEDNDFAKSLIALDGVINIFIVPQFVTVTKEASVSWNKIVPAVEDILTKRIS